MDGYRLVLTGLITTLLLWVFSISVATAEVEVDLQRLNNAWTVNARFCAPVSPSIAFRVMTDYDHMSQFVPSLKESRILWREGDEIDVLQRGDIPVLFLDFPSYVILHIQLFPNHLATFHTVAGNMAVHGKATVTLRGSSVLVTYDAILKPDYWVPPLIGAFILKAFVRDQMAALQAEMLRLAKARARTQKCRLGRQANRPLPSDGRR